METKNGPPFCSRVPFFGSARVPFFGSEKDSQSETHFSARLLLLFLRGERLPGPDAPRQSCGGVAAWAGTAARRLDRPGQRSGDWNCFIVNLTTRLTTKDSAAQPPPRFSSISDRPKSTIFVGAALARPAARHRLSHAAPRWRAAASPGGAPPDQAGSAPPAQPCGVPAQPCGRETVLPCNPATVQLSSRAAVQPCRRAAVQPCTLPALELGPWSLELGALSLQFATRNSAWNFVH